VVVCDRDVGGAGSRVGHVGGVVPDDAGVDGDDVDGAAGTAGHDLEHEHDGNDGADDTTANHDPGGWGSGASGGPWCARIPGGPGCPGRARTAGIAWPAGTDRGDSGSRADGAADHDRGATTDRTTDDPGAVRDATQPRPSAADDDAEALPAPVGAGMRR
jgi:hypothetical protein